MRPSRPVLGVLTVAVLAATLTGCSIDTIIWGADGARVIDTTEAFVAEMAAHGTSELLCADAAAELGEPADWAGLSAGEPEEFVAGFWDEQAELEPQWSINVEGLPEGVEAGDRHPGDVFYRDNADGLCVIDVAWWTLEPEG